MLRALSATIVVILGAAAAAAYFSFFIVHQNEQAIVLEFGKPVRIINEPGLYWKIPVVQTVDYFEAEATALIEPEGDATEVEALTLTLVKRIQLLGQRYGETLGELDRQAKSLDTKVTIHLTDMGVFA